MFNGTKLTPVQILQMIAGLTLFAAIIILLFRNADTDSADANTIAEATVQPPPPARLPGQQPQAQQPMQQAQPVEQAQQPAPQQTETQTEQTQSYEPNQRSYAPDESEDYADEPVNPNEYSEDD